MHGVSGDQIPRLTASYQRYHFTPAARAVFETWFLPLYSWHAKNNIGTGQVPALLKHFHRARLTAPDEHKARALRDIQQSVEAGDTTWLTRRTDLATAVATTSRNTP